MSEQTRQQKDTGRAVEPHLADMSTLTDAATWIVAIVGGVAGNLATDAVKATARALVRRFGRRQLLGEVERLPPPTPELSPSEVRERSEELLRQAEDEAE